MTRGICFIIAGGEREGGGRTQIKQDQPGRGDEDMRIHYILLFTFVCSENPIMKTLKKKSSGDFTCGPVVKNPPSNAEDVGCLIPGRGPNIPHAVGQLSPRATTREPV